MIQIKQLSSLIILLFISQYSIAQNQWYKKLVITPEIGIGKDFSTNSGNPQSKLDYLDLASEEALYQIKEPLTYGIRLGWKINDYFLIETGFNKTDRTILQRFSSYQPFHSENTILPIQHFSIPVGLKLQKVFDSKIGIEFGLGLGLGWYSSVSSYEANTQHPLVTTTTSNFNGLLPGYLYVSNSNPDPIPTVALYSSIGMTYYFTDNIGLQLSLRYNNELYNPYSFTLQYAVPIPNKQPYENYNLQFHSLFINLGLSFSF